MAEGIEVTESVRIPEAAIEVRSVRASGPGGQNVNKVSSKIELAIDLARIEGLSEDAAERLRKLCENRLDAEGRLRITAQESRDRSRNLETAREKAADLVRKALVVPKERRATRPSRAAKEGRLQVKKRDSRIKVHRRDVSSDSD
jgi:ribosome-associated protein